MYAEPAPTRSLELMNCGCTSHSTKNNFVRHGDLFSTSNGHVTVLHWVDNIITVLQPSWRHNRLKRTVGCILSNFAMYEIDVISLSILVDRIDRLP